MTNQNHNIGNAGEFYVLAQLSQLGYIAGKTDDGQTLIDIIATNPKTLKAVNIQVKTKSGAGDGWLMSAKNEAVFDGLWYVLVQLNGISTQPDFYIFHSSSIGPWIHKDHQAWLGVAKRDGTTRKDTPMRRFRPRTEDLAKAKSNWQLMFSECF